MTDNNDIAIIGLSGIFPEADTIEDYWENIVNKRESIQHFSDDFLVEQGVKEDLLNNSNYVKAGTVLNGAKEFDAQFFDYTPREAEIMDPQQRKFLEVAWAAYENAGYATDSDSRNYRVGVFGGITMNTYILQNLIKQEDIIGLVDEQQIMIGNDKDYLTSRVSYKLNFVGPSIVVQTGCSSSLYAIHLACQSILIGESYMALAGGSSIRMPLNQGYMYYPSGTYSKNGHCYTFDKRANGSVAGSGVGVVVLKRFEDAVKDNDTIHAIIKGSSIGNDGINKAAFNVSSLNGQARVIEEALALSGINPETISYVEGQGTATQIGDPIEFAALTESFKKFTNHTSYCALGSVKTNIGHLDTAVGVAGLIKVVMALKNKKIPSNSNFESPNENIDLENSPFYINRDLLEWKDTEFPRRAAINSVGMGGNDAFMILEEAPISEEQNVDKEANLLVLSAKTESALDEMKIRLNEYLINNSQKSLTDMAYTLQAGRNKFSFKSSFVFESYNDLLEQLRNSRNEISTNKKDIVFIFGGNGFQYINMGKKIYYNNAFFKDILENYNQKIEALLNINLLESILEFGSNDISKKQEINDVKYIELCLFLLEISLADLLKGIEVFPKYVLGEDVGLYVAAVISGRMSFETAVKILKQRSDFFDISAFLVLKVNAPFEVIKDYIENDMHLLKSYNDKIHLIKSNIESIYKLEFALSKLNIKNEKMFNFSLINQETEEHYEKFEFLNYSQECRFIVDGLDKQDSNTWSKNFMNQNFNKSLENLYEIEDQSNLQLIVIGYDNLLQEVLELSSHDKILSLLSGDDGRDYVHFLETIRFLWNTNSNIELEKLWTKEKVKRIPLPTYPFEKSEYWIEGKKQQTSIKKEILEKIENLSDEEVQLLLREKK